MARVHNAAGTLNCLQYSIKARDVSLGSLSAAIKAASASCTCFSSTPEAHTTRSTSIKPVVMVPVLSKHKVSTRANVSIQYSCCTSTFDFERRTTATAKTVEVSKINPSGIMPISAATVLKMQSTKSADVLDQKYWLQKRAAPTKGSAMDTYFTILFNVSMISDCAFLCFLASALILLA